MAGLNPWEWPEAQALNAAPAANAETGAPPGAKLCRDSAGLGPSGDHTVTIGYVESVHGPGGAEVPSFVPTADELITLVDRWYRVTLDYEFFWFAEQCVGSCETRLVSFAHRRIERIATALGEARVQPVIDEIRAEYAKKSEWWDAFLSGNEEAWEALERRVWLEEEAVRDWEEERADAKGERAAIQEEEIRAADGRAVLEAEAVRDEEEERAAIGDAKEREAILEEEEARAEEQPEASPYERAYDV